MNTTDGKKPWQWPLLTLAICIASFVNANAQTHYQIGVGWTNILDTYLSQEKFHGTGLSLLTTREKPSPMRTDSNGRRWGSLWQHQVHFSTAHDRANNSSVLETMYKLYYGRYRRFNISDKLDIHAGALVSTGLGVIYNTRNINNPVQARFGLQVMPSVKCVYRFPILRRASCLRYQLDLPLAGVVFSPNYGQSYYEMFSRGSYDRNIVPTTFVSAPSFRQQLSLLYSVGRAYTVSIGYLGDYQQQDVNNLKQHVYVHSIMAGVAKNL